jgi:hypothetical protein
MAEDCGCDFQIKYEELKLELEEYKGRIYDI